MRSQQRRAHARGDGGVEPQVDRLADADHRTVEWGHPGEQAAAGRERHERRGRRRGRARGARRGGDHRVVRALVERLGHLPEPSVRRHHARQRRRRTGLAERDGVEVPGADGDDDRRVEADTLRRVGGADNDRRGCGDRRRTGDVDGADVADRAPWFREARTRSAAMPPRATPPASMRPPRLRQVWSAMHLHRTIVRSQDAVRRCAVGGANAAAFTEVSSVTVTEGS